MIDRTIVKLKSRRGTDAQRKQIILEDGEFYYTTDKERLFVGNGETYGGIAVGSKAYIVPELEGTSVPSFASFNDIIFNESTGITYIVNLNQSTNQLYLEMIGSNLTLQTIQQSLSSTVEDNSITIQKLNSSVVDPSGAILLGLSGLKVNYDTSSLAIVNNKLSVLPGSGNSNLKINTNNGALVNAIDNGVSVNPDGSSIKITNNKIGVVDYESIVEKVNASYDKLFNPVVEPTPDDPNEGSTTDTNSPTTTFTNNDAYVKPYAVKSLAIYKSGTPAGLVVMHDNSLMGWGYAAFGCIGTGKDANPPYPMRSFFDGDYLLNNPTVLIKKVIRTFYNAYALLSDGTLWSTGLYLYNESGWYTNLGNLGITGTSTGTYFDGNSSYIFRKITFPVETYPDGTQKNAIITDFDVSGNSSQKSWDRAPNRWLAIHALAISENKKVYSWGNNEEGQCGVVSDTSRAVLTPKYTGISDAIKVYCCRDSSYRHRGSSFILTNDGRVFASGSNAYGILGTGNTNNISNFQEVNISQSGTIWAKFYSPEGMIKGNDNNYYICDWMNNTIRKITTSTGNITTYAGISSAKGITIDNINGSSARFSLPRGITKDSDGNLYICDSGNHRIRKIDTSGNVTIFAGLSTATGTPNGAAYVKVPTEQISRLKARFNAPTFIDCDAANKILYISDSGNHCIRRLKLTGNKDTDFVDTIAGITGTAGNVIGQLGLNRFNTPQQIAVSKLNPNLIYVADGANGVIKKIDLSGSSKLVTTIATSLGGRIFDKGWIGGIALSDDETYAFVTNKDYHTIYKVYLKDSGSIKEGTTITIAGLYGKAGLSNGNSTDQTNGKILFNMPTSLYKEGSILYVTEGYNGNGNNCIRKIILKPDGTLDIISTFAGNIQSGGNDGICSLNSNANASDPIIDIHGNPGSIGNIYLRTQKGYVYSCGLNDCGQLGIGTTIASTVFQKVKYNGSDLSAVLNLAVTGDACVMAIVGDNNSNKLYTWGYNGNGTVGNGTLINQISPTPINYLPTSIRRLVPCWTWGKSNVAHAVILKDGTLWAAGATGSDRVFGNGITTNLTQFTKIYFASKNIIDACIISSYADSGGNAIATIVLTSDSKIYQSGAKSGYFTGPTAQTLTEYREVRF